MEDAFTLTPVPQAGSARRLHWQHLPPAVRRRIAQRCGAEVLAAHSHDSGFTPVLASTLELADGGRVFVKAAPTRAQAAFARALRTEAGRLAVLPVQVPATRLLWVEETDGWTVLALEHVAGRLPERPWTRDDVDAVLDSLTLLAEHGTTTDHGATGLWGTFADEFGELAEAWGRLDALVEHADLGAVLPHRDEARRLARAMVRDSGGETIVHTDLRDDNVLIDDAGRAVLLDWNWPVRGAAWIDAVIVLLGPAGDGHDVDAVLAGHPLTADVPADLLDGAIALLAGYYLTQRHEPVPPNSPWLRQHQSWYAVAAWEWLARRRGWG